MGCTEAAQRGLHDACMRFWIILPGLLLKLKPSEGCVGNSCAVQWVTRHS